MALKVKRGKLVIWILFFLLSLIIGNYNFQEWRTKNRKFNESVGLYIYDTSSVSTVMLSKEESLFFDGIILKLNDDGTFEFSKLIPKFGAKNGTWSVGGRHYSHWLDFKFENGLLKQVGPCFEKRIDFFYPNNPDLIDSSIQQKPNGILFFIKIDK